MLLPLISKLLYRCDNGLIICKFQKIQFIIHDFILLSIITRLVKRKIFTPTFLALLVDDFDYLCFFINRSFYSKNNAFEGLKLVIEKPALQFRKIME